MKVKMLKINFNCWEIQQNIHQVAFVLFNNLFQNASGVLFQFTNRWNFQFIQCFRGSHVSFIHSYHTYNSFRKKLFLPFSYTSYNNQAYCTPASAIQTPSSVEQVQAIVRSAIEAGQTVKAIGNLHSINDIACTEGIPIRMTNINYTRFDEEDDSVVTLGVGIELTDALAALSERNRSLIHVPTFGKL